MTRVALAQTNPVIGDITGNRDAIIQAVETAREAGAQIIVTPELAISGYPADDLLLRRDYARACWRAVDEIAGKIGDTTLLLGFPEWDRDRYNSAAVISEGRVQAVYRKRLLPNHGVFDEARYFRRGQTPVIVEAVGTRIGIMIGEDIWHPAPVVSDLAAAGVDVITCLSASPWHRGKTHDRERMLAARARDAGTSVVFCNQVGGQDELVFDGSSCVIDHTGRVLGRAESFREQVLIAEIDCGHVDRPRRGDPLARANVNRAEVIPISSASDVVRTGDQKSEKAGSCSTVATPRELEAEVWEGIVTGLRDYVCKSGFSGVVIGLSGGIDSALTAALAADALGSDRVHGVTMPSRYTSQRSNDDAAALASLLGISFTTMPIREPVAAFEDVLREALDGAPSEDTTAENLQARARGTLLMALSNRYGWLVLAPGNKSEMAVGYSTLHGDMVGGLAPLRDLTKTWVYRVSRWRNAQPDGPRIPESTIERPPTAELRPGQRDTDSLPPYDVLDPVIEGYVEDDLDADQLVARGHDPRIVARVIAMIDRAEYKRRQGPPGIKVSPRAFGKDRRMPIIHRYRT